MFKRTPICAGGLLALGATLWVSPVAAQQTVEVTGSRIKRTDAETASPVQVLTRDDIERTGKQSIQDVLRGLSVDGQGSIPSSFSAGFASGSAGISLRGLGVNSTLVLVNGRRMTSYGLADDGTRNFVDINSLPLEAVEKIEVLKDGASAIYGADAVGGVVNIILRKTFSGASIGGSYGQTGKSDGKTTRAFGSFGFGSLESDKYNFFGSLEVSQQKNIWSYDRGFIGRSDLSSFGYYDLTNGANRPYFGLGPTSNSPYGITRAADGTGARVNVIQCDPSLRDASTGLCRYDPLVEQEVQPAVDRLNFFGRGSFEISSTLSAYVELGYFNTKTRSNGTLGANNDPGVFVPGDPFNPLLVHGAMTLPASHPDNTFGVDRSLFIRPQELGGRDQKTNNKILRIVEGLQGSAFGWDFDLGASYVRSKLKNQNFGYIRYDVMQNALNNGTYRITSPSVTDPSVLAAISPTLENNPISTIKSVDFNVRRDLTKLPGGPLAIVLGAEARSESSATPPVPYTDTAEIVGLGYSAFSASRRVYAGYAELNAPVVKWLELNGALRYDHYSDFGSTTNPKVGFKVKPIDQFALRGTYSEAFRAPGPAESGGSTLGFTTFGILSQGDPSIQPETAKNYTLGLVFEPIPGTSVTLDFWKVDRRNEIVQADPAAIVGNLPTSGTPFTRIAGAQPNTFIYYDVNGEIGTVTGFYRNAAKTNTQGIDLELRHRMNLGAAGKLGAQMNWSHTNKYRRTDADGNTFEYAGTHGPLAQSAGGGTPKDRITLSLNWDYGLVAITTVVNYVGKIKMVDHKGEQTPQDVDPDTGALVGTISNGNTGATYPDAGQYDCGVFDTSGNIYSGCKLPSFTTVDLFARWTPVKNLDINFGIQNLFDKKAPFDAYLAIPYSINYNQTWHQSGAVGRFFTIGAKYTF